MKAGKKSRNEGDSNRHTSEGLTRNIDALQVFINSASEKYSIPVQGILSMLGRPEGIPVSVLQNPKLGIMESVVKYLKEELSLSYHKIAVLLKRDDRVVWVTYHNAAGKHKERFETKDADIWIPASVFASDYSPLASVVMHLASKKFTLSEISRLLNRNPKSVWAAFHKNG